MRTLFSLFVFLGLIISVQARRNELNDREHFLINRLIVLGYDIDSLPLPRDNFYYAVKGLFLTYRDILCDKCKVASLEGLSRRGYEDASWLKDECKDFIDKLGEDTGWNKLYDDKCDNESSYKELYRRYIEENFVNIRS